MDSMTIYVENIQLKQIREFNHIARSEINIH